MFAGRILGLAAAGGVAFGTVAGMAFPARMHFAPLRPWQDERSATAVDPVTVPMTAGYAAMAADGTGYPGYTQVSYFAQVSPAPLAEAAPALAAAPARVARRRDWSEDEETMNPPPLPPEADRAVYDSGGEIGTREPEESAPEDGEG